MSSLQRSLKSMPAKECVKHGWLPSVTLHASCLKVTFVDSVIDWLKPTYGALTARRKVDAAIKATDRPMHIAQDGAPDDLDADLVVKCYEVSATDKALDCAMCPCESEDGSQRAQIRATIKCSDEVQLRDSVLGWWTVEELRQASQTVLLVRRHSKASSKYLVPEYKEVCHLQLIGCLARRTDYFPNLTAFAEVRAADEEEVTFYFQLPAPNAAASKQGMRALALQAKRAFPTESAALTASASAEGDEGGDGTRSNGPTAATAPAVAAEKAKVSEGAKAHLAVWCQRKDEMSRARSLLARADPLAIACDARLWTLVVRALKSVCRGDTDLLRDVSAWTFAGGGISSMVTGGAGGGAESISGTGEDHDGRRAVDGACSRAWEAQRPFTNCDQGPIAKARAFLRAHGMDDVQEYMDAHGNVDLTQPTCVPAEEEGGGGHARKPHRDALATKVLATARKALMNANLIFYSGPVGGSSSDSGSSSGSGSGNVHCSGSSSGSGSVNGRRSSGTIIISGGSGSGLAAGESKDESKATARPSTLLPEPVTVPCVVNEFDTATPVTSSTEGLEQGLPQPQVLNDRVVSHGHTVAEVTVGDILYVEDKGPSVQGGGHRRTAAERQFSWLAVKRVDLLYARLRVKACEAPPLVWLLERRERGGSGSSDAGSDKDTPPAAGSDPDTDGSYWLPIAELWNVLVSRCGPDHGQGAMHYLTFMTPIPNPAEALAMLSRLPRRPTTDERRVDNKALWAEPKKASCSIKVLHTSAGAVVIGWTFDMSGRGKGFPNMPREGYTAAVLVCPAHYPSTGRMPWREVFRGTATACQIGSLVPACSYHIKVVKMEAPNLPTHLQGSNKLTGHVMATTLAPPPVAAPAIVEWSRGIDAGTVRLVTALSGCNPHTNVWDSATKDAASRASPEPLPEGCHFVLEAKVPGRRFLNPLTKSPVAWPDLGIAPEPLTRDQMDAKERVSFDPRLGRSLEVDVRMSAHLEGQGDDAAAATAASASAPASASTTWQERPSEEGWCVVAHGASPYLQCVGPWSGKEVFLRARVVNSNSEASDPSPVLSITAPYYE